MENSVIEYILSLANYCDKNGHKKIADSFDQLIKDKSFTKVAQYVGTINYCLKNSRCFQNCIRRSRLSSDAPMQEIVLECLKEYQDGQKYYDEDWIGKYASNDEKKYIDSAIKQSIESGIDIVTASNSLIEEIKINNDITEDVQKLNNLWENIKSAKLNENKEFQELGEIIKQAGFWSGVGTALKGVGKGISKGVNWGLYQTRYKKLIQDQTTVIQEILAAVNTFNQSINGVIQMMPQGQVRSSIEAAMASGDINKTRNAINSAIAAMKKNPRSLTSAPKQPAAVQPTAANQPATQPPVAGQMPAAAAETNTYKYIYKEAVAPISGQLNAGQVIKQLMDSINNLNEVTRGTGILFQNMSQLAKESRVINVAANEVAALNRGMTEASKNPLNTENIISLNTMLGNLDKKLRNSFFQQQQNPQQAQQTAQQGAEGETVWEAPKTDNAPEGAQAPSAQPPNAAQNVYQEIPKFISGLDPTLKPAFINALKETNISNIINALKGTQFDNIAQTLSAMQQATGQTTPATT